MYDSCVTASTPAYQRTFSRHVRQEYPTSFLHFAVKVTAGNLSPLYLGLPDHTKYCRIDYEEMSSKFSSGRLILSLQKSLKPASHSHSVCC